MAEHRPILIEAGGVAKRLGVSRATVRRMERDGRLPESDRLESSGRRVWRLDQLEDVFRPPERGEPAAGAAA